MLKMTFLSQDPYIEYYGQGDSTFIEFPNGQNMLVDVSKREPGASIAKKLLDMGVRKIDYFVASHLHRDHTEGFAELAKKIEVRQVILSGYGFKSAETDQTFLKTVEEKRIPMQFMRMGDRIQIGEARLEFLFPPKDIPEVSPELPYVEQEINSNIYSLVFRLSYGKFSALFTGDIYERTENELISIYGEGLASTLLKLPHHGGDTSAKQAFMNVVKPQLAVTMCRSCEWAVQQRFSNAGIPVYGPFYDGTITLETDGNILQVECKKGFQKFPLV